MSLLKGTWGKGLTVAVMHVALIASVGAKFAWDRATYPRVWARTAPVDPNLPIRGRYVRMRIEAVIGEGLTFPSPPAVVTRPNGSTWMPPMPTVGVSLAVRGDQLVALPASDPGAPRARLQDQDGRRVAILDEPLAFFIPEHAPDPSRMDRGEELWVEVTVPRLGSPRPIQLGRKKDGVLSPLDIK